MRLRGSPARFSSACRPERRMARHAAHPLGAQRRLRRMSSPDEDLRTAMAAHKAERFDEAEAGYLRVLEARSNHPKALYYLGLLQFHRGDTATAIKFVQRCLNFART